MKERIKAKERKRKGWTVGNMERYNKKGRKWKMKGIKREVFARRFERLHHTSEGEEEQLFIRRVMFSLSACGVSYENHSTFWLRGRCAKRRCVMGGK